MQEANRIKASNKVYLENKFTLKKCQLLDSIKIQISQVQEELEESLLQDKQEVINQKTKIITLQKQVDSNNELILEQETIIQQLILKLKEQDKHQLQIKLINRLYLTNNILQIKIYYLNLNKKYLRLKHYQINLDKKLIDYAVILFVCNCILQNQDQKYNKMILIIIFFQCQRYQIIRKLKRIQNKNWNSKDINVQVVEGENEELKKENQNLKRCLKRFNVTQNLDSQKQQTLIQQLQDQLNDQQLLISDYSHKIKQYEQQNQCKQLNDFLLKKRKVKNQQPVFNLELLKRKQTLDVFKSREEIIHTSIEPRIHSKTVYYKY